MPAIDMYEPQARREVGVGDCGKFEERFCMPVVGCEGGRQLLKFCSNIVSPSSSGVES